MTRLVVASVVVWGALVLFTLALLSANKTPQQQSDLEDAGVASGPQRENSLHIVNQ